ncbi:MAG: ABC transporter permease [Litorilituus sp.]|jgi:predicted permease|nr:ABC transporter permease [Litorilituus sp.]
MNLFTYQLKQAWLSLKKKPGFVLSVVSTMGITLGALLCVLTLAYVMLIKPLPYPEQARLYSVEHHIVDQQGESEYVHFDYPTLIELYKKQKQFTQGSISYYSEEVIRTHPQQPSVNTAFVTPEWFSLLDVPMVLGRAFEATEGFNSQIPVAVLSYKTWQDEYSRDPNILNKKIIVNDVSYSVIGVVSSSFIEPQLGASEGNTQLWLPWSFNSISYKNDWWGSFTRGLFFIGSLPDDISSSQVSEQLRNLVINLLQPIVAGDESFTVDDIKIITKTLKSAILGDTHDLIYMLLIGVVGLTVIAVSNIINVFISHAAQQRKNISINAALGARKSQIFSCLLAQASILMLGAVILAIFVSSFGFTILTQYLHEFLPRVHELSLQIETLLTIIFIAILFAFAFALLTTNTLNYQSLNNELNNSGKGTGIQVSPWLRQILIISQIAIASALVFCNISLMLDAAKTITQPLGYQRDNLNFLSLSISEKGNSDGDSFDAKFALLNQVKSKLLALPQVEAVSTAESPLGNFMYLAIRDVSSNTDYQAYTSFGDERYFDIIGQEFVIGDNFPPQNKQDRDQLLIINDVFAKKLSPNESPVGRKLDFSSDGTNIFTIIGVVKGTMEPGQNEIPMRMYAPSSTLAAKFLIKTKPNQLLTREQVISTLNDVSSLLAVSQFGSLNDTHKNIVMSERVTVVTAISTTILSLLLAATGLYGILSYSSQIRRFEIGIRMAVGAKSKDIILLIFRDISTALVVGVFSSILVLLALYLGFSDRLTSYVSFELVPLFFITLILISLISFIACYLPLRQYISKPVIHSLRGSE